MNVDGTVSALEVAPNPQGIDEAFIQRLVHVSPGILPIDEIGPAWGPLVSLGREIKLTVGLIDNLLISPQGEITLVEAKLWRNPESRRKVVGQILDYAAALSKLTYSDLEAKTGGSSIWKAVSGKFPGQTLREDRFHDAVVRNLREGRFLLLVVGDGIREDLRGMADLLSGRGDLGFHLELVELRVFNLEDDILVVPSLVGRTSEVVRAVVRVEGAASVSVEIPELDEADGLSSDSNLESIDAFVELMASNVGKDWASAASELLGWWSEQEGGIYVLNQASITLGKPNHWHYSKWSPIASLKADGTWLMTGPSFVARKFMTSAGVQEWAAANDFSASRNPLRYQLDLSDAANYETATSVLIDLQHIVEQEPST